MIDHETHVYVQLHGLDVRGVHIEHADFKAPTVQVVQSRSDQAPAQAWPAGPVGVDRYDVDLSQRRVVLSVHLRPAEAVDTTSGCLVKEEPLGIEPRLLLALLQRLEAPTSLLGVPAERPVVHAEPLLLVDADTERASCETRPWFVECPST